MGRTQSHERALLALGCFWGPEFKFRKIQGVISVTVGYCGGHVPNPTYEMVCSGQTGHAESVEVVFDPNIIAYVQLLDIFFTMHDPTTRNRQGPDIGSQYRSIIFYDNDFQWEIAEQTKQKYETMKMFKNAIVTEIRAATTFYPAEEYHQRYLEKQGKFHC
jgi:peptide-methionine (S)-S-oxide reductase